MFIQNEGNPIDLALYAMTSRNPTTVTFRAPWIQDSQQFIIDANRVAVYRPPSYVAGFGSQYGSAGISVTSTLDVSVFGVNTSPTSCGGFMAIPAENLGTEYFAVTYEPENKSGNRYPQIGIVATQATTNIRIELPPKTVRVLYGGRTFTSGQTIVAIVDQYESIQLQDQDYNDLTGTKITANSKIAVFSGNVLTEVSASGIPMSTDHVVAQIPPVSTYGTTFSIVPTPDRMGNDIIKIVAREANTRVSIAGNADFMLQNPGDYQTKSIPSAQSVYITATKPILVAQFVESARPNDYGSPSLVVVPPIEQYRNFYVFSVSDDVSFDNYVLMTIDSRQTTGVEVDGVALPTSLWRTIPGQNWATTAFLLRKSGVRHYVRHVNNNMRLGAYVYGSADGRCTYAYSAGSCSDDVTTVSIFPTLNSMSAAQNHSAVKDT